MMDFPVGNDPQPDHYSPQAKVKDDLPELL